MTADTTITPELLDQLLANYEKPEDLTGADGLVADPNDRRVPEIARAILAV
jgi:hypothetical protein